MNDKITIDDIESILFILGFALMFVGICLISIVDLQIAFPRVVAYTGAWLSLVSLAIHNLK